MDLARYATTINPTDGDLHDDNRFDDADDAYAAATVAAGAAADSATAATWWESGPVLLLGLLYALVIGSGVFGNASLLLTICTQTSARFRNPLLVALCAADLMVAAVAAPLTLVALLAMQQRWALSSLECKGIYFMQVSGRVNVATGW